MGNVTCGVTGKTHVANLTSAGRLRLPRGWRRLPDGRPCSPEGWAQRYELRVIEVVIAPADKDGWPSFRDAVRVAWRESTALANWALRECFDRDVRRTPDSATKMPKPAPIYLYGLASQSYPRWWAWHGAKGAAQCTLRRAESRWRHSRYGVLWLGNERPAVYGYPQPYPLDADQWTVIPPADQRQQWRASLALPGGRVTVDLRQGHRAGRNHTRGRWGKRVADVLEQIAAGDYIQAEAAIRQRYVPSDDHHSQGADSRGGVRRRWDYVLKLVGYVPREDRQRAAEPKTLYVVTQPDCLLCVLDEERDRLWVANYDRVRRWVVGYSRRLQRLSEDSKHERRRPRRYYASIVQERLRAREKHRSRMDSAMKQLSAEIAGFAARSRATRIEYRDTERSWIVEFPWRALREKFLRPKVEAAGIEFVHVASGDVDAQMQ